MFVCLCVCVCVCDEILLGKHRQVVHKTSTDGFRLPVIRLKRYEYGQHAVSHRLISAAVYRGSACRRYCTIHLFCSPLLDPVLKMEMALL